MMEIKTILEQFTTDHGIVDIFNGEYSMKDIIASLLALSKLQINAAKEEKEREKDSAEIDVDLLERLYYYSVYASAAYGWKLEAVFSNDNKKFGFLPKTDNNDVLASKTGITNPNQIIATNWSSKTHRPAYFIVREEHYKSIVLSIRGTLSGRDLLTDLCASAQDFSIGDDVDYEKDGHIVKADNNWRAHHGMLQAALSISDETKAIIKEALVKNPNYTLVIVGHSLGAGVASILGTLWKKIYPSLKVYCYGSPCVGPINSFEDDWITSVINDGDPFATLSIGHIATLSQCLAYLCENSKLRKEILSKEQTSSSFFWDNLYSTITTNNNDETHPEEQQQKRKNNNWCSTTLQTLQRKAIQKSKAEKVIELLYPPGRTFYLKEKMDDNNKKKMYTISEISNKYEKFSQLRLHPSMFDISRHIPSLYESSLQEIITS